MKQTYKVESYIVPEIESRIRLSDFKAGTFNSIPSRKGFKSAIKDGLVKVNGDLGFTSTHINGGEVIDIYRGSIEKVERSIDIDIEVFYEDQYLAIVNKPAGVVVSGNRRWTLENALAGNLYKSDKEDALPRAEPIHRLDYPTSGALLVGKTMTAVIELNNLFKERAIEKRYFAITIGDIADSGVVEVPIDEKSAKSLFRVVDRAESPKYGSLNLTELTPYTGRKHQLRIHMLHQGTPILGDLEHCIDGLMLKGKGLYLHASSLSFIHPFSNEKISVTIPLPKKFRKIFPDRD